MDGPVSAPVDSSLRDAMAMADLVFAHFDEHRPEAESFPMIASKVIDTAEQPDVNAAKISKLIECDSAICAAVLAMANSAASRPLTPITGVQQAVARLGLKDVTNIAVGVACRSLFDMEVKVQNDLFAHWWERLFHSAMTEAFTSDLVAKKLVHLNPEGIFLASLLHDVGKSLGLRSLASLIVSGQHPLVTDDTLLERMLGHNRSRIGAIALKQYCLPPSIVQICSSQDSDALPDTLKEAHTIRLVGCLNALRLGTLDTDSPMRRISASARALSLSSPSVVQAAEHLCEQSSRVSVLFSTSDSSDESGFIEFLQRCLDDV